MRHLRIGTPDTETLGTAHWIAIGLAAVTGLIHVYAGVVEGRPPVTLAGVGFLVAVGLFLRGNRRRTFYLVGVAYTAMQLPLWYVVKAGAYTRLGFIDKAVQIVLIVVLLYLYRTGRETAGRITGPPAMSS